MTESSVSVVIAVSERVGEDVRALHTDYRMALATHGVAAEFVYVLDGPSQNVRDTLTALQGEGEQIKIVQLAKWFGEATALTVGVENAAGEVILTLPSYSQVSADAIGLLLDALPGHDMVVGRRWPRVDTALNRMQTQLFNAGLRLLTDSSFRDLGCGARAFRRHVLDEIHLYGDQHRFLPLLAMQMGFRVVEVDVAQSPAESGTRVYRPGVYLRRVLDLVTVFFLVKFTKKPLRFFGLVGSTIAAAGGIVLAVVVIQRLFFAMALADRPALLLASLLLVLGLQLFAIGLIGELIIVAHAGEMKEYKIDEIVEAQEARPAKPAPVPLREGAGET